VGCCQVAVEEGLPFLEEPGFHVGECP
jgi:hypothetical protein